MSTPPRGAPVPERGEGRGKRPLAQDSLTVIVNWAEELRARLGSR